MDRCLDYHSAISTDCRATLCFLRSMVTSIKKVENGRRIPCGDRLTYVLGSGCVQKIPSPCLCRANCFFACTHRRFDWQLDSPWTVVLVSGLPLATAVQGAISLLVGLGHPNPGPILRKFPNASGRMRTPKGSKTPFRTSGRARNSRECGKQGGWRADRSQPGGSHGVTRNSDRGCRSASRAATVGLVGALAKCDKGTSHGRPFSLSDRANGSHERTAPGR